MALSPKKSIKKTHDGGDVVTVGEKTYKKKPVTLQSLVIADGQTVAVMILGRITASRTLTAEMPGKAAEKSARTCPVGIMETGETRALLCNAVMASTLEETYPEEGYIGKIFEITCVGKVPGKRYKGYTVHELEEVMEES